jgi:hypothetical protein
MIQALCKQSLILVIAIGICVIGMVSHANARFVLSIDNKATLGVDVFIVDNEAGDMLPQVGAILYGGSLGFFQIEVNTAFSNAPHPLSVGVIDPNAAILDLGSFSVSATSTGTGELEILVTDTDFLLPGQEMFPMKLINSIGGTMTIPTGSVVTEGLLDVHNQEFAMGGAELSTGILGPLNPILAPGDNATSSWDFSGSKASVGVTPIGLSPFSLTEKITIIHHGANLTSFDKELRAVVTPEPNTLLLLGTGLIGLAGYGWRRRSRSRGVSRKER